MASNLILTTAQAQAVYSAMCALEQINARNTNITLPVDEVEDIQIIANDIGILVERRGGVPTGECYADQAAFAAAYGLPCGMAFTVAHVDHGAIVVDHVQAPSGDAALAQAQQQGLTDPVVFAGHIKAQASA